MAEAKVAVRAFGRMRRRNAVRSAHCLGYVHYRFVGVTLVSVAFVIPSLLMAVALGWAYVGYGGLTWRPTVFYGVGASVVIGIIAMSAPTLTTNSVGREQLFWGAYCYSRLSGW